MEHDIELRYWFPGTFYDTGGLRIGRWLPSQTNIIVSFEGHSLLKPKKACIFSEKMVFMPFHSAEAVLLCFALELRKIKTKHTHKNPSLVIFFACGRLHICLIFRNTLSQWTPFYKSALFYKKVLKSHYFIHF